MPPQSTPAFAPPAALRSHADRCPTCAAELEMTERYPETSLEVSRLCAAGLAVLDASRP